MTGQHLRWALGAVLLVALGTGGESSPRAPQPRGSVRPPAPRDPLPQRLCDALHALPAERKGRCCGRAFSSLAVVCTNEVSASLRRGALAIDPARVDACAAETTRSLEACDWVTPLMPPLPDACRGALLGRLAAGDRCRSSVECPDGLYCRGLGPGRDGTCAAPGTARAPCEVPADRLAAFARAQDDPRHPVCAGLCVKGQCVPFAPPGRPCQSPAQCVRGLSCVEGRCQERSLPRRGEPCAPGAACDDGASCRAGRCQPLMGAGEPCRTPFECRALACVKAPGAEIGTCGDPCGADLAPALPSEIGRRGR